MRITREGFEKLKADLQKAEALDKEIIVEIEEARKQGDLSENADYSAAMDKKRENDALIGTLRSQINTAEVVSDAIDTSKVEMNAFVTILRLKDNTEKVYQIGDSVTTDPDKGIISEKSPIGKALIGHKVGEVVTVEVAKPYSVKILNISATR
jgi:transcription elongation factor GreA